MAIDQAPSCHNCPLFSILFWQRFAGGGQEQEGWIAAEWGTSENNRKAKYYKLTRAGRKQLEREAKEWNQTTAIDARFFEAVEDTS
jgi:hypothetical protein